MLKINNVFNSFLKQTLNFLKIFLRPKQKMEVLLLFTYVLHLKKSYVAHI